MATFAIKCPHCLRDNTSFTVRGSAVFPGSGQEWKTVEAFATCNACHRGVVGTMRVRTPYLPAKIEEIQGTLIASGYFEFWGTWCPAPPTPDVPEHLPAACAAAFTEAEQLRLSGFRGPSGNAYRRALEAGIKEVAPELKGNLYSRIEQLTAKGELVTRMKDLAHRIRTLGNEASHETPVVEDDEIDDLAVFTRLFLMYQFTLPGMLPMAEGEMDKT